MSAVGRDWTFNPSAFPGNANVRFVARSQAEYSEDHGLGRDDAVIRIAVALAGFESISDDDALMLAEAAIVRKSDT